MIIDKKIIPKVGPPKKIELKKPLPPKPKELIPLKPQNEQELESLRKEDFDLIKNQVPRLMNDLKKFMEEEDTLKMTLA